jgi:hypothetical protein
MHRSLVPALLAFAALTFAPGAGPAPAPAPGPAPAPAKKKDIAAPKVTPVHVADVTPTTATVRAGVDARGAAATYVVEWGATTAYGARTPDTPLAPTPGNQDAGTTLQGLTPGTTYHVRVTATNAGGSGASNDAVFRTAAPTVPTAPPKPKKGKDTGPRGVAPPTPAPDLVGGPVATPSDAVLGRAVVVGAEQGVVNVKVRGSDGFTPLGPGAKVPVGSVVDATRGTVRLTTEVGDGTQGALLRGASFEVRQDAGAGGMTDLVLRGGDFSWCGSTVARSASRGHGTGSPRRSLWAKDSGGRFRTHGRNSVATVRGTEWITTDTCAGTTTRVRSGAVLVRDLHTGRRVLVRAGHGHLVRPRRG